jgi:hypothetical protein
MTKRNKILKNRNWLKSIALVLLGVFLFAFSHSELGFLDYDGNNHGSHDYCEIIKDINHHVKSLKEEFHKLDLNKSLCTHCIDIAETQTIKIYFVSAEQQLTAKHPDKIYIVNKSFLI